MAAVKQLFLLITIVVLGTNIQLCASENQSDTDLLNYADSLERRPNPEPKNIAAWIRNAYRKTDEHSKDITEQLKGVLGSDQDLTQKTMSIKQMYTQDITPKKNDSYFSNMSSAVKAAAAFVITAGIVSYFYFMRPWATSNTQ